MTYTIFVSDDRVKFIVKELGDKAKVIDNPDWKGTVVPVEVTIESASDVLNVFHAGINAGLNVYK